MRKNLLLAAAMGVSALGMRAGAQTTVLYNGSLGTSPNSQPWLAYLSLPVASNVTTTSTATTLDTTSTLAIDAGYSNYLPTASLKNSSFPVLNSATGFTLSFDAQVNSESHTGANGANRAGFDVIALDKDDNGIELGFWGNDNEVWAQGTTPALFTMAETATFNSESAPHDYSLSIVGSTYTLFADGTQILTGPTRNYSAYPNPVYSIPNYVFLGDDTTDAAGSETISSIAVTVPEPVTGTGMILLCAGVLGRRRRA